MAYKFFWLLLAARRELWKFHRRDRGRAFVLVTLGSALFDAVLVWACVAAIIGMIAIGAPIVALAVAGLAGWLVLPHLLVEHVAIPLGAYRSAFLLARFDPRGDRDRWPYLCAARAAARRGSPDQARTWLEARLAGPLDGTRIAAWAIFSHGRGDRDDARRLLRSLADLADPAPEARSAASEWLALDAAERGAWQEILDDARALAWPARGGHRTPRAIDRAHGHGAATDATAAPDTDEPRHAEPLWPATPIAFLLEGVAGRLLDRADAPSQLGLWLRWLLAPHRRATRPLVRAALAPIAPARSTAVAAAPAAPSPAGVHAQAIAAHARALADVRPATAAATVAAWGAVVDDPTWLGRQIERAYTLGVSPDLALAAVTAARDQLVASLVDLAIAARTTAVDHGGSVLASTVAMRARARILDGLELSLERAHDRIQAREGLPQLDEWRAFLALRAGYDDAAAAGGVALERVAYPHADDAFGAWAVWLWNERSEYVTSHAISAWLYERALVVGDAAAIEVHGRNGALDLPL